MKSLMQIFVRSKDNIAVFAVLQGAIYVNTKHMDEF